MFQRFHAMREEREQGGFTLIELLVVILIIAILAAIAIPVFLRQREKGWRAQMESAVKNAATAEESWLTTNSQYTNNVSSLVSAEGLKFNSDVGLTIAVSGGTGYCIRAQRTDGNLSGVSYFYHSESGRPTTTAPSGTPSCP